MELVLDMKDTKHKLRFVDDSGPIEGILRISMEGGSQEITFLLPPAPVCNLDLILLSWESQMSRWTPLVEISGEAYVGLRAFKLESGHVILWHIYHLANAPFDAVSVVPNFDLDGAPRLTQPPKQ